MNQSSTSHLQGLTAAQAAQALAQHGPNALPEAKPVTLLQRLVQQFRSPLIYILLAALLVDLGIWIYEGAKGVPVESLAIALTRRAPRCPTLFVAPRPPAFAC